MFFVRDMAVQGQFLSKFNGSRQCLASERGTRDRQPCLRAARVPGYGKDSDSIARAPTADCLPPRTPNKSSDRSGKLVNNYHLSRAGQFQGILKWMIHNTARLANGFKKWSVDHRRRGNDHGWLSDIEPVVVADPLITNPNAPAVVTKK